MKEKQWKIGIGGDEICEEVEVSWSQETEEKLRKDKLKYCKYCREYYSNDKDSHDKWDCNSTYELNPGHVYPRQHSLL